MVPTVELPPATPSTYQVTAVLAGPVTVAVYCKVVPVMVDESTGATLTVAFTAEGVIVTMRRPVRIGFRRTDGFNRHRSRIGDGSRRHI